MKKKILALTLSLSLILGITSIFAQTSDTFKPGKNTILALGDSITTGYGLIDKNDCYVNRFASEFDPAIFETNIINKAVDGYTSSDLLNQLQSATNTDAEFVTLTIGGNNILKPLKEALDAKIKPLPPGTPNPFAVAIDSLLKDPAAVNNMSFQVNQGVLKFHEDFPKIINAIADAGLNGINTAITQVATVEKNCIVTNVYSMFKDRGPYFTNIMNNDIHPNSIGHETIANSLFDITTGENILLLKNLLQ